MSTKIETGVLKFSDDLFTRLVMPQGDIKLYTQEWDKSFLKERVLILPLTHDERFFFLGLISRHEETKMIHLKRISDKDHETLYSIVDKGFLLTLNTPYQSPAGRPMYNDNNIFVSYSLYIKHYDPYFHNHTYSSIPVDQLQDLANYNSIRYYVYELNNRVHPLNTKHYVCLK